MLRNSPDALRIEYTFFLLLPGLVGGRITHASYD